MSNLNLLNKINNNDVLNQFLHCCVDDLIKLRSITYNTFSNNIEWSNEEFNAALKSVQDLFSRKIYESDETLSTEINDLDSNRQESIIQCYKLRKNDIVSKIITNEISTFAPLMTEFDWRLRLVMGSAKLSNFIEPLLQLDIKTMENNNNKLSIENIPIEMNENELTSFIDALQAVNLS